MARKTILRNKTGTLSLKPRCFIELINVKSNGVSPRGRWIYFRIKARNGRILCHSEQYSSPRKAMDAAKLIAETAIIPIFEQHG